MGRAARLFGGVRANLVWIGGVAVALAQVGYVEEGEASYYAPAFHGRRTASGERYDRRAYTAAHRTLPFGTVVRVTDKATGRSVLVRINDRGPFKLTRIIDLSEQAAKELGILARGVAQVRVEVTQVPEGASQGTAGAQGGASGVALFTHPEGRPFQPKPYAVQIGAFSELVNARALAHNAQKETGEVAFVWRATHRGQTLYRVLVGSFAHRKEAEKLRDRLKQEGWKAFVVHLPV